MAVSLLVLFVAVVTVVVTVVVGSIQTYNLIPWTVGDCENKNLFRILCC